MGTLGQIIFYSMVTLIVLFSGLIILILALTFTKSPPQVLSSNTSPIASEGQDKLLSCYLQAASAQDSLTQGSVTWMKTDVDELAYLYVNGAPDLTGQSPQFRDRAQLFPAGLAAGNASLLLRNVTVSDEGPYTCTVSLSGATGSVNIQLRTTVFSVPTFTFSNHTLNAAASRWYPKPNVTWSDGGGEVLQGNVTFTQSSSGTFSVISSLSPVSVNSTYSCNVSNDLVTTVSKVTVTDLGVVGHTDVYSAASSLLASLNFMTCVLCFHYLTI